MPVLDKNLNHEFSTDITAHFPFPTQRATQTQAMNGVQEAFRGDKKFYILEGPTGFGKCFASDTPVLMYDGTVKMVQNVLVGELLMGDDSTPRRVLSLSHGFDEMFDVVPVKGDAYRVNSRHILSLKFTKGIKTKGTYANNQKSQVPQYRKLGIKVAPVAIIDILLRDYLSLSKTQKHILKGYRVGVEFSAREVSIDPYFLGLWLGDGDSDCPTVTSADNEIGGFLYSYAAALGLQITSRFHNGACTMALTTGEVGGDPSTRKRNPLLDDLRGLGVLNNKHIPRLYKCNSREIRLKLLAGIIDSDGHHIVRGGYEFVFVVKRLAEDLTYLCRSLGLAAYMEPCEKTCTNGKNGPVTGQYYRVLMSGFGVERIPSMLLRKQSRPRRQKKNPLVTGVQVSSAGNGEFFGFSVDGNGRFLLGDFTVVHNSGVGIAAASWAKTLNPCVGEVYERGAHILSPQKVLTKQYVDDFGSMGLVELKGQANYTCHGFTERAGMEIDCETAAMLYEEEHNIETCTGYKPAKRIYQDSPLGVTNFDYFLNETMHAGQLKNRNLLVLDECHNAENKILGFTDTTINRRLCEEYGVVGGLPIFEAGRNQAVADWLTGSFVPASEEHRYSIKSQIKSAKDAGDKELTIKLYKRLQSAERFMGKVNYFLNAEDRRDWLAWSDWDAEKETGTTDLTMKPLTATLFADDILFSKAAKVLLMSATILDFPTFMRNLGIDRNNAVCLAVDSEFPLENRPIFFKPCGNMGFKHKAKTLPKMAAFLAQILRKYATKKGIVHTHSYDNNRYFINYLKSEFGFRIITHDNKPGSRDRAVLEHISSPEPTVLFSPSMTEGLDLKEDLARFCVVTKVPYPFMDPYVKARMERDPAWYQWLTALVLEQATGRVVRSNTDKAHTYILDEGFRDFFNKNQCTTSETIQLSKWWTDSIIGLEPAGLGSSF